MSHYKYVAIKLNLHHQITFTILLEMKIGLPSHAVLSKKYSKQEAAHAAFQVACLEQLLKFELINMFCALNIFIIIILSSLKFQRLVGPVCSLKVFHGKELAMTKNISPAGREQ